MQAWETNQNKRPPSYQHVFKESSNLSIKKEPTPVVSLENI